VPAIAARLKHPDSQRVPLRASDGRGRRDWRGWRVVLATNACRSAAKMAGAPLPGPTDRIGCDSIPGVAPLATNERRAAAKRTRTCDTEHKAQDPPRPFLSVASAGTRWLGNGMPRLRGAIVADS